MAGACMPSHLPGHERNNHGNQYHKSHGKAIDFANLTVLYLLEQGSSSSPAGFFIFSDLVLHLPQSIIHFVTPGLHPIFSDIWEWLLLGNIGLNFENVETGN
ncbi:hypothetical protein DM860_001060 [Cuscuta australis]|uniref:Uncharacterized protein n=1 Tax=Cuscuta australis TaxID=267555 RepID=A0A328DTX8_9ASTE|nr:hypothetical protein DM860_001060 [Cuscuta australis]